MLALFASEAPSALADGGLPPWAASVSQSLTARDEQEEAAPMTDAYTIRNYDDGSVLLSGPGVFVAAVQPPHQAAFEELDNVARHPLDIAAIALPSDCRHIAPEEIMASADRGYVIVRDEGNTAVERATNFMRRVLELRVGAIGHLRSTMVRAK